MPSKANSLDVYEDMLHHAAPRVMHFSALIVYSVEQEQYFKMWKEYDDSEDSFCEADGQFNIDL